MSLSLGTIPTHIPKEFVRDVDFYNLPGADEDIHLAWKQLQKMGDVFWTPRYGGHWIATRGALIKEAFLDPVTFSNKEISIPREGALVPLLPIQADGKEHVAYRALLQPSLTPKAVSGYADFARDLAISLIEEFYPNGECEFIAEFALKLPLVVFLKIVDLPLEDREMLRQWAETMARDSDVNKRLPAFRAMLAYIDKWVAERLVHPGDDLLSKFAHGKFQGRSLTQDEIRGLAANALFGGLDTVAAMLGFAALFLANSPEHRKQLVDDPSLIPNAAEELLRRFAPATISRLATRDVVFHGAPIKKDEMILLPAFLHGLDESEYQDPLNVNFRRSVSGHASFGYGPHRCPGSLLARTELKIFLEEWLKRIPNFKIKEGEKAITNCGMVSGLVRLPLQWTVG